MAENTTEATIIMYPHLADGKWLRLRDEALMPRNMRDTFPYLYLRVGQLKYEMMLTTYPVL